MLLKAHLQGHLGAGKMEQILKASDYWPNILLDCEEFTRTCLSCLFVRPPRGSAVSLGAAVATAPNEIWQIDIVSGLPHTKLRYAYFASVIDMYTKFLVLLPLKLDKAQHIAEALEQKAFSILGVPKYLITEGASNLAKSHVFKSLSAFYGFELRIRTPYSSHSLGAVERVHRSVLDCIRSYKDQFHIDWATALPMVNLVYNQTKHSATGCTPAEMVFGRRPHMWTCTTEDIGGTKWSQSEYCDHITEELDHIRSHAKKLEADYSQRMRDRFNGENKSIPPEVFVLALDKSPAKKMEKLKLSLHFTGPFLVHEERLKTVLAESCRTGKLGYLHKQFLRIIPENGGHTYAQWQELLHQDKLLQALDREKDPIVEYGIEDLAALASDEDCAEARDETQADTEDGDSRNPFEDESEDDNTFIKEAQEQAGPEPGQGPPTEISTRTGTNQPLTKRVTFEETAVSTPPTTQAPPPPEAPHRSGLTRQLPARFRDD